jgi:chemotaxis protein CheD
MSTAARALVGRGVAASVTEPIAGGPPAMPADARARVYLHPGHLFAAAAPTTITTILGSCVSVCLYDPALSIGGANHFLLPHATAGADMSPRFGGAAITRLVERMVGLGSERSSLRAKLFGGACVLDAFREREHHLGTQNVEAARRLLEAQGIAVQAEDVGGSRSRKLLFQTDDGTAWVRML